MNPNTTMLFTNAVWPICKQCCSQMGQNWSFWWVTPFTTNVSEVYPPQKKWLCPWHRGILKGKLRQLSSTLPYYFESMVIIILHFISICVVIKRNESYVGNIDFEIHPIIVWNSFCILLFSATHNCLYLWNRKSDFDKVFGKTKLSECFHK